MVTTCTAFAILSDNFKTWEHMTEYSADIVIARCVQTPEISTPGNTPNLVVRTDDVIESNAEIITVLKGKTKLGLSRLASWYSTHQGEYYLVFANYRDGFYQAIENYRVIPIGTQFSTNDLTGKTLDNQIRMLLKLRLDNLNKQIREEQAEKKRLEEAFKK